MKTYKRKRQEHQEIEDVQKLCRLCLNKAEEGVPIFRDGQDVCAAVAMRIMICVGLEMKHEDSLPNMVCINCYEDLERYYKFRRKCEVSYHKLNSHILALKEKENINVKMEQAVEDSKLLGESPEEDTQPVMLEKEPAPVLAEQEPQENVNVTEQLVEMKEVQIPIQTEVNPDIGTFLTTILLELGILTSHETGLMLQDQGITSFELETGDDEQLMLELVEEDDDVAPNPVQIVDVGSVAESSEDKDKQSVVFNDVTSKQNNRKGSGKAAGAGGWCGRCARAFSSASAAARHARAHAPARPHACALCRRTFKQKAVLDRHMLVHREVRPHACPQCPKSFTQRAALAAHARAHAAPHARALALHRCTLCDKVFLYASGLSRHMMSHAGRMFSCSACERQFQDRSSLLRHLKHFYHDRGSARPPPPPGAS